jgi:replicative DNA helicase
MSNLLESPFVRQFDRLPPHSIEAEMCVIGSMLLAGNERAILAAIRAEVDEADFFQADHAILFGVIVDLMRRDKSVDAMVIREELTRRQMLEEIGGLEYLAAILSSVPHYANGPQYAEAVRSKAVLRRLIAAASDALRAAYSPQSELTPSDLCRRLADTAAGLSTSGLSDPVTALGDAGQLVLDRRNSPQVRRIATGIDTLDAVIGGLAKSKFTIIGADPRVGKSQLIKQIGLNVASRGTPFGLVTVEEDREKVAENMLANRSQVPNHKISYGNLNDQEWDQVERGAFQLANLPYYIDDAQHKIGDVVSAIERLATKYKCEVIAVDHIHLITGTGENREREISEITKAMKAAFKRCNVAGIGAAQLNRGQEARQKPILKSLKGTSSLESDGDLILLLFREDAVRYQESGYVPTRILEVNVAKNKDGKCGEVPLEYSGDHQSVSDPEIKDPF